VAVFELEDYEIRVVVAVLDSVEEHAVRIGGDEADADCFFIVLILLAATE
jgi:hypothetical protein